MTGPTPAKTQAAAVLIGHMGAGKTSVGKALAAKLGAAFLDTDSAITEAAGQTIPELFRTHGEDHFRELEHQAVVTALQTANAVVALGGGAVARLDTQAALTNYREAGGTVVFLQVSAPVALARIGENANRPMLLGNPAQRWEQLQASRLQAWLEAASVVISTDQATPEELAEAIAPGLPVS